MTVDTQAMLDEAMAPRRTAPFVARLRADLADGVLPAEVAPRYSVDPAAMKAFIAKIRTEVDTKAQSASVSGDTGELVVTASKTGTKLDATSAEKAIQDMFTADKVFSEGDRSVTVRVKTVKPRVTEKDLGHTIIVSRSGKALTLYDGVKVEKKYRCAVGTPDHPTPLGHWEIVNKQYMPAWYNPGSEWAKSMPKVDPARAEQPVGNASSGAERVRHPHPRHDE